MTATVPRVNVVALAVFIGLSGAGLAVSRVTGQWLWLSAFAALAVIAAQSPRIAQQWERAVVLRFGRFVGLRGPGLFWIVPFADSVSSWIDQRTITTSFAA